MLRPFIAAILLYGTLAIPLNRSDSLLNDHVEQMPIERDGDLNENFRQEMIFSHNLDTSDTNQLTEDIREMFEQTDTNMDGFLTPRELKIRIQMNMLEHLNKSKRDSDAFFKMVDANKDGMIEWEEFEPHFRKMNAKFDENKGLEVPTEDPGQVEDEKRMFNRSDITRDGRLDGLEWHVFLHPEYSAQGLVDIVNDLISLYDANDDKIITREEFVNGIPGSVDESNPEFAKMEKVEKEKRSEEFDMEIDLNSDGNATFRELYEYVDPQNFRLAFKEVNDIMMLADADDDGKLTLEEMLERDWLLARSSLLSVRKNLHDEM
ncbi:unnamed protein product [Caenorhabditis sp. 36 PRJEB53466]|nr:unnamed protein product [Caenorhabditis sp. 36 PRJEB53466]